MTVLAVVRDVCAAVGVAVPGSVFAGLNSNRTMQEMLALANEMAQRIAYNTREWTKLKKTATYAGDGSTTAFDLPADYKRMLLATNVWRSTSTMQPMMFVASTDEWLRRRAAAESDAWGEWTLLGDQMHIYPAMGTPAWANSTAYVIGDVRRDVADNTCWKCIFAHLSNAAGTFAQARDIDPLNWTFSSLGTTAYYSYLDKNCVALASGGYGDRFMADGDNYRLDERILKLGMQWQWKALKGAPYAEDMGSYGDAIAHEMGADQPAPIMIDRQPMSWATVTRTAYPWTLPS